MRKRPLEMNVFPRGKVIAQNVRPLFMNISAVKGFVLLTYSLYYIFVLFSCSEDFFF